MHSEPQTLDPCPWCSECLFSAPWSVCKEAVVFLLFSLLSHIIKMYLLVTCPVSSTTTASPSALLLIPGHFCLVFPTHSLPFSLSSWIHPAVTSLNCINSDATNSKFTQIGPGQSWFFSFLCLIKSYDEQINSSDKTARIVQGTYITTTTEKDRLSLSGPGRQSAC